MAPEDVDGSLLQARVRVKSLAMPARINRFSRFRLELWIERVVFWSSPAVAGGKLLLRGVDALYCIADAEK